MKPVQAPPLFITAPRAIIFDWDNTLVNTWPVIHQALNRTFAELGLPEWEIDATKQRVRKSMRDSFPELFGPNWQHAAGAYQQHYRAHHLEMLEALPGAEQLLAQVRARGVPAVVVSNKKGPNLRTEVNHLGWGGYFMSLIGADDAARDKPHPDPVHLALSVLDIAPGPDIWFVGDSEIDLETAVATGCTGILYGDYAGTQPGFTETHYLGFPYAYYVPDHESLIGLLKMSE